MIRRVSGLLGIGAGATAILGFGSENGLDPPNSRLAMLFSTLPRAS